MNKSCPHSHIPRSHVRHASFICVAWSFLNPNASALWLLRTSVYMSHVKYMNKSCHTFEWVMSHIWLSHVPTHTCFIHMCDMSHSYVWHDSFICVTCLIYMCDMSHSYVWHALSSLLRPTGFYKRRSSSVTGLFPQRAMIIGLFGGKWPINIRLRHPIIYTLEPYVVLEKNDLLHFWVAGIFPQKSHEL